MKGAKETILYRDLDSKGLEGSAVTKDKATQNRLMSLPSNGKFKTVSDNIKNLNELGFGSRKVTKKNPPRNPAKA